MEETVKELFEMIDNIYHKYPEMFDFKLRYLESKTFANVEDDERRMDITIYFVKK